jgi:hypothetical protein
MTAVNIDVDAHELTALTTAIEEYKQHTSARGELLPHLTTLELQAKVQRSIDRTLKTALLAPEPERH